MYAGGVGGRSVTKCACRLCQRGLLREHVLQLVPDTTLCRCVRALYAVLLPCVLITRRAQSAVPPTLAKTTAGAAMCGACVVLAVASRFMCSLATGRVVACAHLLAAILACNAATAGPRAPMASHTACPRMAKPTRRKSGRLLSPGAAARLVKSVSTVPIVEPGASARVLSTTRVVTSFTGVEQVLWP